MRISKLSSLLVGIALITGQIACDGEDTDTNHDDDAGTATDTVSDGDSDTSDTFGTDTDVGDAEYDIPDWSEQACAGYTCCETLYDTSSPWGQPIFAEVIAEPVGTDSIPEESYFTWDGVVDLTNPVTTSCPSQYTADETPRCSVDYAVQLTGASSAGVEVAIGMERAALESVPMGTEVTVEQGGDYLVMRDRSSSDILLAAVNYQTTAEEPSVELREAISPLGGAFWSADLIEDPSQSTGTTTCMTEKNADCSFYWAVQDLVLGTGTQTATVEPMTSAQVEFNAASWFVRSEARAHEVAWGQMCAREFGGDVKFAVLRDLSTD
jgi:hypothetical protein